MIARAGMFDVSVAGVSRLQIASFSWRSRNPIARTCLRVTHRPWVAS